MSLHGK